jgi:hypothetical protein
MKMMKTEAMIKKMNRNNLAKEAEWTMSLTTTPMKREATKGEVRLMVKRRLTQSWLLVKTLVRKAEVIITCSSNSRWEGKRSIIIIDSRRRASSRRDLGLVGKKENRLLLLIEIENSRLISIWMVHNIQGRPAKRYRTLKKNIYRSRSYSYNSNSILWQWLSFHNSKCFFISNWLSNNRWWFNLRHLLYNLRTSLGCYRLLLSLSSSKS